jgi:hypothetical protein
VSRKIWQPCFCVLDFFDGFRILFFSSSRRLPSSAVDQGDQIGQSFASSLYFWATWDRCYDFLNISAEKNSENIGVFGSNYN